jgi:hypothetical protein
MLTKRKVETELLNQIEGYLKPFGFKKRKTEGTAVINYTDYGFDSVVFRVIDYMPEFWIEFSLRIRLDIVENIVNKFYRNFNQEFSKSTVTDSYGYYLMTGNDLRQGIRTERDLINVIDEFKELINNKGFNYWEKYRDIKNLFNRKLYWFKFHSDEIYKYWKERYDFKYMNAYPVDWKKIDESEVIEMNENSTLYFLVLAKLSGSPEYDKLCEIFTTKTRYLPDSDGGALPNILNLIEYLKDVKPIV